MTLAFPGYSHITNIKKSHNLPNTMSINRYSKYNKKNFNFVNSGFNLRPLDVSAAIGLCQFRRLNQMIDIRTKNRNADIPTDPKIMHITII